MGEKDLSAFLQALEDGADPDCRELIATGRITISPLETICSDLPSLYPNKLDYVRPLVEKGVDLSCSRWKGSPEPFIERVLVIGYQNYLEGDQECAGYLLAHLVAGDISSGNAYDLEAIISKIFLGIGTIPGDPVGENSRIQFAKAITRNQHALVDYVATSTDPIATYLRSREDHPSSDAWMKKIDPVNHTEYPRPESGQSLENSFSGFSRYSPIVPTPSDSGGLPCLLSRFDLSKAFERFGIAFFGKPEGPPSVMHDEDGIAEFPDPFKGGPKGRL